MIDHGIHTTKADYWVHFFPLDAMVYWYRVDQMRSYIELFKPPIAPGHSFNDKITGQGYLIPRTAFPVDGHVVPGCFIDCAKWQELTQRERGLKGEVVIASLIERQFVKISYLRIQSANSQREQFDGFDFVGAYFKPLRIEGKTECPKKKTDNIFVQFREGGHEPNITPEGRVRVIPMPGFTTSEDSA